MNCPMAIRCLDGVPYCDTCNPTRAAVLERTRLDAIADAETPQCRECGADVVLKGDERAEDVIPGGFTCPDCAPHDYTVTVYLRMAGKQGIARLERAIAAELNEHLPDLTKVDCEAFEDPGHTMIAVSP